MRRYLRIAAIPAALLAFAGAALGEASEVFAEVRRSVVTIVAVDGAARPPGVQFAEEEMPRGRTLGSGIILSKDGLILTANHTVSDGWSLAAVLQDMREVPGEIVAAEPLLDVALVRIRSRDLTPLPWRTEEPARVGETVFAIGTPSAFGEDPSPSVSRGIISALHRTVGASDGNGFEVRLADLIETDAQLSPGESGGALVDGQGRLLGMCLAVYRPQGGLRGRSYAVPADSWLRGALDELVSEGRAPIGNLGAAVSTLATHRARLLKVPPRMGVEVARVDPAGPFERAGILVGDIVTAIDGEKVRRTTRFKQLEMRLRPGSAARISVVRPPRREEEEFVVKVGRTAPESDGREEEFAWRGMRLSAMSEEVRRRFATHWLNSAAHYRNGVVVTRIGHDSSSYRAGLRAGDVIVEINNVVVKTIDDFRKAVAGIPDGSVVRVCTMTGIGHIQGESLAK